MNLDWHWYKHSFVWLAMILAIPLTQPLHIDPGMVEWVEYGQTVFLLCCFIFTLVCALATDLKGSKRAFWLWAALWWLVLLGRDQNWGRQLIPDYPRVLYHIIGGVLIGGLIVMLFWPQVRQGIKSCFKQPFPVWDFVLAAAGFLLADAVERQRWFAQFVLYNPLYDDLLEELYEVPFMLALFSVSLCLQLRDVAQARETKM
ncbi:hypothetical protein PT286_07090 [Neisseriaceae bacterium ESL0693]|nr:hypothetical protein [Neisseriaceae bacterium ESL0693]